MLSWKTWSSSLLREALCSGVWRWVMTTARRALLWHAHTNKHKETDAGCHEWGRCSFFTRMDRAYDLRGERSSAWIYLPSDFNLLSAFLLILLQITYWSGRSIRNTPLTFVSGLPTTRTLRSKKLPLKVSIQLWNWSKWKARTRFAHSSLWSKKDCRYVAWITHLTALWITADEVKVRQGVRILPL